MSNCSSGSPTTGREEPGASRPMALRLATTTMLSASQAITASSVASRRARRARVSSARTVSCAQSGGEAVPVGRVVLRGKDGFQFSDCGVEVAGLPAAAFESPEADPGRGTDAEGGRRDDPPRRAPEGRAEPQRADGHGQERRDEGGWRSVGGGSHRLHL
ncbi:MAG: hypothetical protein HND58_17935 [Planctomycetota bacterium]|nr:MAG: hypothetical protein HND58_17935 [Planctomycetota bacterium]